MGKTFLSTELENTSELVWAQFRLQIRAKLISFQSKEKILLF